MRALSDLWTNLCLALFFVTFAAWFGAVLSVHGRNYFRRMCEFLKKQPAWARVFLAFFFVSLWLYGSEKPMRRSALSALSPRELTSGDFARGFVLTRIGQNETFDFSIVDPSNTVVRQNWLLRGAANDAFVLAPDDWSFPLGTNAYSRLLVGSHGAVFPLPQCGDSLSPFQSSLGVVPEGNWRLLPPTAVPSRFWSCRTPAETLQFTWQNILYNRATNAPVSMQLELYPNGNFVYRYDLSRAGLWNENFPTNIFIGAIAGGISKVVDLSVLTNLTSLSFQRLEADDFATSDRDGDGLTLSDELFVYGTNPYEVDTDLDGLSDFEEATETGSDPTNTHSLAPDICDGMAAPLGDLDQFACPTGSTNTVWEHLFYTGTTNAPIVPPQTTDTDAVLAITVSGMGSGELIIGSRVVPLLSPPARTLILPRVWRVSLPRGRRESVWLRTGDDLSVALSSEDFCIGKTPTRWQRGWIAFPFVKASEPCIHDLSAKETYVSLSPGEGFDRLTCQWQRTEEIEVENLPPLAARLTGSFPPDSTTPVSYVLAHPDYLSGRTTYSQTARFCPPIPARDLPEGGYAVDEEYDGTDEENNEDNEEEDEDFCRQHYLPYVSCSNLHSIAFTNALMYPQSSAVLKIRDAPEPKSIHLSVPDAIITCCPCPDHWTNAVVLVAKSLNLAVRTVAGERFTRTTEDCDVFVHALAPSKDFFDSALIFARTGVVCQAHRYTALGMDIKHRDFDLPKIKKMCPSLGLPIVSGTNGQENVLLLKTLVDLPLGDIRLSFANATARFKLYLGAGIDEEKLLLDTETRTETVYSLANWKKFSQDETWDRETRVTIVALGEGSTNLKYEFAVVHDGVRVSDTAQLKITAIPPPLLADYDRDGIIDGMDKEAFSTGRPLRHWINNDNDEGDVATSTSDLLAQGSNADCLNNTVDGRCDLLDFAPVGLDLLTLAMKMPQRGHYEFRLSHATEAVNILETDLLRTEAGDFLRSDHSLESASVSCATSIGVPISMTTQLVLLEGCYATTEPLVLSICKDGEEIISFKLPLSIWYVDGMFRWMNLRGFLTGNVNWWEVQDWEPANLPDAETKNMNVFFLHGFKVSEEEAWAWGAEMFKRLWQSGSNARFWAVTWLGDGGTPTGFHYNDNVYNAFLTAPYLASRVNQFGTGEKIVMAHSLGNMLVSSAIQDHGMNVSKYFMLNSAVPSEAYNPDCFDDSPDNPLVHDYWRDYTNQTWSCKWHELFDSADDRHKLIWKNRFPDVASIAYNYYSSGDEVLELLSTGTPEFYDGVTDSLGRYAWHKQESYKGRLGLDNNPLAWAGTTWSGWGFRRCVETVENTRPYTAQEANAISREELMTNTVFKVYPSSMNTNVIPRLTLDEHLAKGIPALSKATGATNINARLDADSDINIPTTGTHPNGWWRPGNDDLDQKWLHSDIKDAAYYYIYPTFDDFVDKGGLK